MALPEQGFVVLEQDSEGQQTLKHLLSDEAKQLDGQDWKLCFEGGDAFLHTSSETIWASSLFSFTLELVDGQLFKKCKADGTSSHVSNEVITFSARYYDVPGYLDEGRQGSIKLYTTSIHAPGCAVWSLVYGDMTCVWSLGIRIDCDLLLFICGLVSCFQLHV